MRGRNSKSTPPKHADRSDYQLSTGFEALLGYLPNLLKGDEERLHELVEKVLNRENRFNWEVSDINTPPKVLVPESGAGCKEVN